MKNSNFELTSLVGIEFEREKLKTNFWQTLIVSGAAVIIVGIISAATTIYVSRLDNAGELALETQKASDLKLIEATKAENTRILELQKAKNVRDVALLQAQADLLASFKDEAISENITTRIRFAHMFSLLSLDDASRDRWSEYHSELKESYVEILKQEKAQSVDGQTPSVIDNLFQYVPLTIEHPLIKSGCDAQFLSNADGLGGNYVCP